MACFSISWELAFLWGMADSQEALLVGQHMGTMVQRLEKNSVVEFSTWSETTEPLGISG